MNYHPWGEGVYLICCDNENGRHRHMNLLFTQLLHGFSRVRGYFTQFFFVSVDLFCMSVTNDKIQCWKDFLVLILPTIVLQRRSTHNLFIESMHAVVHSSVNFTIDFFLTQKGNRTSLFSRLHSQPVGRTDHKRPPHKTTAQRLTQEHRTYKYTTQLLYRWVGPTV